MRLRYVYEQHYIEEGVDHVFIYNDASKDGTKKALECVDSRYYTLFNGTVISRISDRSNPQREIYSAMYSRLGIRDKTHWLAVVDVDEFISSRADPYRTMREILIDTLAHCDAISVPWLLYTSNRTFTAHNRARYSVHHRWGYDERYQLSPAESYVPDSSSTLELSSTNKFANRHSGVENKVIFRTYAVPTFQQLYTAVFPTGSAGTVCIPRVGRLACSSNITDSDLELFRDVKQRPSLSQGFYRDAHNSNHGLERWCPHSTTFKSGQSPFRTLIVEADIPYLLLACFHYQVKSAADWYRKSHKKRFNAVEFQNENYDHARRIDVFDSFMTSVRNVAREDHADFAKAADAISTCPKNLFAESEGSIEVLGQSVVMSELSGGGDISLIAAAQERNMKLLLTHELSSDRHFLAIMALVRDEVDSILEFVQV